MVKIVYKDSSIECTTKEEARYVLLVLNEIRKDKAKQAGLKVSIPVGDLSGKVKALKAPRQQEPARKPKPN
jgi:hypothetical protein